MSVMEDQTHRSGLVTGVRATMSRRARQQTFRFLYTVVTVAIFHPPVGLVPALAWLLAVLVLQGIEGLAFADGHVRDRWRAYVALSLIFAANMMFAALAVLQALNGGLLGVACGILLTGSALIHAILGSGCSRIAARTASAPHIVALLILPLIMVRHDADWTSIAMLAGAGALLSSTAYVAWRQISRDMIILDDARKTADRANQAKSDFLTMVSHEIRTPLNGVMGMAQSLARDPLTESQRDRIETLIHSGQGLNDMIDEVLDLSRIEAGSLPVDPVPFDLRGLVERSVDPFDAIARTKGLKITVSLCPGLARAYLGDPVRIRQVLHNLISNAVQRTVAGAIMISASRDADAVQLSVCDSGGAIAEEFLAGALDRYALLEPSRGGSGTGLGMGLCMANEFVLQMNGFITAANRLPGGLCLTVSLPLAVADGVEPDRPADQPEHDLPRTLRVLVAEDHPVNRKALALILDQIDVVPVMVENGLQAVQACRDGVWDLVLMDIQMPVMDGISAARQIRTEAREAGRAAPPIMAVTANVMAHQRKTYLEAGIAICIPKPIVVETLFSGMQDALDSVRVDSGLKTARGPSGTV